MKITTQLLRSRSEKSLHSTEYLDLSDLGIDCIEKLTNCPKLHSLKLHDNNLGHVSNLECCNQLWNLDLCNNQIQNLEGLSRFVAMGTLVLSNNNLNWQHLAKIRHMHILCLSLHGNPRLESDPYYRIHVIDSLPNVWMLDGRMITSAERLQVQHFFEDSAATNHPVRHKLKKEHFTPTGLKKIQVTGVFGEKTVHLMRRFPVNSPSNIELDQNRLKYLAYTMQEDIFMEYKAIKRKLNGLQNQQNFLEELVKVHSQDKECSNMLLLLLIASLEFAIPAYLMKKTLVASKLGEFGGIHTMDLFLLPRTTRVVVVSLLLSAVKIDRDVGLDGGLYDKLYMAVYHLVADLVKLAQGSIIIAATNSSDRPKSSKKSRNVLQEYKRLLASEVVQLMCIVPAFFDYATKDTGVMSLVTLATTDQQMVYRINRLFKNSEDEYGTQQTYEKVASLLMTTIQKNVLGGIVTSKIDLVEYEDQVLLTKKALPRRPQSSPIKASEFHASGRASPDKGYRYKRIQSGRKSAFGSSSPRARLGDPVLLGPQTIARILSIPEPDILLVQMDVVPAENGAMVKNKNRPEEHYCYIDKDDLYYDYVAGYWRPLGTVGDRITIRAHDDVEVNKLTDSESNSTMTALTSRTTSTVHDGNKILLCNSLDTNGETYKQRNPISSQVQKNIKLVSTQLMEHFNLRLEIPEDARKVHSKSANKGKEKNDSQCFLSVEGIKPPRIKGITNEGQGHEAMIFVSGDNPCDEQSPILPSRRSSLESSEEPELCAIDMEKGESTPSIAMAPNPVNLSMSMDTASLRTDDDAIEIPHASPESVSGGPTPVQSGIQIDSDPKKHEENHEKFGSDMDSGSLDYYNVTKTSGEVCMVSQPRSFTSLDTSKMNVSPYQTKRAEAWKPRATSAGVQIRTPPQRPSSPTSVCEPRSSTLQVQIGNNWLAGGKDVYWETMIGRPNTCHIPGWKDGLAARPKSAAAARAMKRSRPPNIITPSSIAYDHLYGTGNQQQKIADRLPYSVNSAAVEQVFRLQNPAEGNNRTLPGYPIVTHSHAGPKEALMCEICMQQLLLLQGSREEGHIFSLPSLVAPESAADAEKSVSQILTEVNDLLENVHEVGSGSRRSQLTKPLHVSWAETAESPVF